MAIINFPDTTGQPTDGSFTYTFEGVLYSWTGTYWAANTQSSLDSRYVEVAGDTMTGNLTVPSLNGGQLAGFRNALVNGDFRVWQRDTAGKVNEYGADRWKTVSNDVQMNNDNARPFGLSKSIRMRNINSSTTGLVIRQGIELPFAGSPGAFVPGSQWTMSFYVTENTVAPVLALSFADDVAASNAVAVVNGNATLIETVDGQLGGGAAQTWYRYSLTFTIAAGVSPASTNLCAIASFQIPAGGTKDYRFAGCQLEPGPVATPFEHRPIGTELALCQRYYQRHFILGKSLCMHNSDGSTDAYTDLPLPVPMRLFSPTVGPGFDVGIAVATVGAGAGLKDIQYANSSCARLRMTKLGTAASVPSYVSRIGTGQDFISLDAEL